jgi:chaperone modulatory protein CbpM
MREIGSVYLQGEIVEEHLEFTLVELCRATGATEEQLSVWVEEGAFEPRGAGPHDWRFSGASLRRALTAQRLTRDLELNGPAVAVVLDLLDRIDALRARLAQHGFEE